MVATVEDRHLTVNTAVVLMQRRLFSPNYDGPGKWVLFDPTTRRSLLAIEQQADYEQKALPTVLRMLLSVSRGEAVDDSAARQLRQAGLLTDGSPDEPSASTFLDRFQRSVYDYPFFDYSTSETFQKDRQLMATYAAEEPAPPAWTERHGETVDLPSVTWEDLNRTPDGAFELRQLAAVLRYTFGSIADLPRLGTQMHFRRTSPSGGAKHPTECWLQVTGSWCGIAPGVYVYDCARHVLVAQNAALSTPTLTGEGPIGLSIRSRVERPMWRYRDGRSFRAVLIDAGHVIETLVALLGSFGVGARTRAGRRPANGYVWLQEPELAMVVPDLGTGRRDQEPGHTVVPDRANAEPAEALATNPAAYFTIDSGAFHAHLVHPEVRSIEVDEVDFGILTHGILSHRGEPRRPADRRTTVEAMLAGVPGATEERITRLRSLDALLPMSQARPFYIEVRRWAERGWYQPLLTWMEATNTGREPSRQAATVRRVPRECDLPTALRQRVTTRGFSQQTIDEQALRAVLTDSFQVDGAEHARAFVAAINVDGLPHNSLHRWDPTTATLIPAGRTATADDLISATIGQQWLKNSAAAIWYVTRLDVARPDGYFLDNVLLGRMAQAVCIVATDSGLGVFQTPAVEDRKFAALTGLPEDYTTTAYLVCIGAKAAIS